MEYGSRRPQGISEGELRYWVGAFSHPSERVCSCTPNFFDKSALASRLLPFSRLARPRAFSARAARCF
jgi:hypothetical protein